MEKIIESIKQLIQPKEKEGNHLDLHVQVNKILWLFVDELQNIHKKHEELVKLVETAKQWTENIWKKMEDAKIGINKVISWEIRAMKEYVQERITPDSFIVNFNGMVSTDSITNYELEKIAPKLKAPYRMEIVAIRTSKTNDNVDQVILPGIQNFEWSISPVIQIKSKWGKAVFEYDFDVLVTKL